MDRRSFLGDILWAHEQVKQLFDGLADVVVRPPIPSHLPFAPDLIDAP